jgi:hypothetical protein
MRLPRGSTLRLWITVWTVLALSFRGISQTSKPVTQHYSDFWLGLNVDLRLHKRWTLLAEGELKRKEFMAEPNAVFACLGLQYHIREGLNVHVAIGRQWAVEDDVYSLVVVGETRAQVQLVAHQTRGRFHFRERLRNEFRWIDRLPSDPAPGKEFHDRVRFLLGMECRIFDSKKLPSLVAYDEYLVETITGFSHPAFDQNRFFIGLRQPLTKSLAVEAGYINVYASAGDPGITETHDVLRIGFSWAPNLTHGN